MLLRGGGAAANKALVDLSRESYNIQLLANYGAVTALIMNAALRLYTSVKFPRSEEADRINYANALFTTVSAICIISGAFTTILFNILGIYSKEALGTGKDGAYLAFSAATAIYRKWGFRSFLTMLASFVGSFLLSLWSKIESDNRLSRILFYVSSGLTLWGAVHIRHVLQLATQTIFQ